MGLFYSICMIFDQMDSDEKGPIIMYRVSGEFDKAGANVTELMEIWHPMC